MLLLLILLVVRVVMVLATVLLQLRLVVVERRLFLVLERDHLVTARSRLSGRSGEGGRGRTQSGWRQRRRDLLHLNGRAQVVRTGTAWYEVLGNDSARIVSRGPVVAHHGLLHGTPASRLPLERWRGSGERQATFVAVVKRGRRQ